MTTAREPLSFLQEFGERVCRARKAARLSQQELADKVGLTRTSIVNIEKGRQMVNIFHLATMLAELRTTFDELVPRVKSTNNIPSNLDDDLKEWLDDVLDFDASEIDLPDVYFPGEELGHGR